MPWPFRRRTRETDGTTEIQAQLSEERQTTELLQEALAELVADQEGWRELTNPATQTFTRQGLRTISARAWVYYHAVPLIRRGVRLKTYYVWGQGLTINARDEKVNELVQAFMDDEGNQQALFGHQARGERERELELDGNVFFALFTSPLTGRVALRTIPVDQVDDIICNPDDRFDRWYYKRVWTQQAFDPATGRRTISERTAYYPDFRHQPKPAGRPEFIAGHPVRWDSPVLHVRGDGIRGGLFGIPEVYGALDWARAYKEFLEDWATIAKALSRFAWRATTKGSKVPALRRAIDSNRAGTSTDPDGIARTRPAAGASLVADSTTSLEPIPKTGATIDAASGRPLAMMVAAALDLPETLLMGNADVGNLATAKTLDRPTELAMTDRRSLWTSVFQAILGYVVEAAVAAPRGKLTGTVAQDGTRRTVTLTGQADATIDVHWPSILEHDIAPLVHAIAEADSTGKMPPRQVMRLLLTALGVDDVDEILDEYTDADGNFISPGAAEMASAGQAAVDAFRRGADPAALLR